MIEKKKPMANHKIVKKAKRGIILDLDDLTSIPRDREYFTTLRCSEMYDLLSDPQKQALGKIEEYWQNKISNFKNWKRSKHFGYRKETISARIDGKVYYLIKNKNKNQIIQNFVRFFLRNIEFRLDFEEKRREQSEKDLGSIMREVGEIENLGDITAFMKKLQELYPYVVSGEIYTIEKELFSFYCYYFTPFSISYNLRCGLLFNYEIRNQNPIKKFEVYEILESLLEGNDEILTKTENKARKLS